MSTFARDFWIKAEPLHALTYFTEDPAEAAKEVGFKGFWMGYFAFRSAPLGEASAALVTATFYNFHPSKVAASVPDVWLHGTPAAALTARSASAAKSLRRVVPNIDKVAGELVPILAPLVEAADPAGRPLFAGNQGLRSNDDPVADLWQLLTAWREHRGDSHIAALRAADLDGCEVHLLQTAVTDLTPELIQASRGWSPEEWSDARDRLTTRGLVDGLGLTAAGYELKESIEASTDTQAQRFFDGIGPEAQGELYATLSRATRSIMDAQVLRFPNPMGLPSS